MKPELLDQLRETVLRQPARLGRLHGMMRDAGSDWTSAQLRLLLETLDDFQLVNPETEDPEISLGKTAPGEELMVAVRQILEAEPGRPMPLARVIDLLRGKFTTSPEQLRDLAAGSADLEIRGPMIRLRA